MGVIGAAALLGLGASAFYNFYSWANSDPSTLGLFGVEPSDSGGGNGSGSAVIDEVAEEPVPLAG
jgi:hypothetical protein